MLGHATKTGRYLASIFFAIRASHSADRDRYDQLADHAAKREFRDDADRRRDRIGKRRVGHQPYADRVQENGEDFHVSADPKGSFGVEQVDGSHAIFTQHEDALAIDDAKRIP